MLFAIFSDIVDFYEARVQLKLLFHHFEKVENDCKSKKNLIFHSIPLFIH